MSTSNHQNMKDESIQVLARRAVDTAPDVGLRPKLLVLTYPILMFGEYDVLTGNYIKNRGRIGDTPAKTKRTSVPHDFQVPCRFSYS